MIDNETIREVVINKSLFQPVSITKYAKRAAAGTIANFETNCEKPLSRLGIIYAYNSEDPQGISSANVVQTGANLFDKTDYAYINGYFQNNVVVTDANHTLIYMECKPNTTYTISRERTSGNERFGIAWTEEIPTNNTPYYDGVRANNSGTVGDTMSVTTTTGATAKYIVIWAWWVLSDENDAKDTMQIEVGSTATTYAPYTATTHEIDFGTDVYGFDLDPIAGTGKVKDVDGVETDFTFTPFNITTYNGVNNIFLDVTRSSLAVIYLVQKPTEYKYASQFLPIFYPDTKERSTGHDYC